jgi:VWFA-related protein
MNSFRFFSLSIFAFFSVAGAPAWTQPAPAQPAGQPLVHAQSTLVVVDITATDDKHNPIHQLTSADFTILEDGKSQPVKVFEENTAEPPTALPPGPKLNPGRFTNFSVAPPQGALNILLFDKLNTPITAQAYVRDQVLKYLKEAPSGTSIAIFALTTDLKMLQGFTSDPELLRDLVEGKMNSLSASPMMNNAVVGDNPGDDTTDTNAASLQASSGTGSAATLLADLKQLEAQQQSLEIGLRQRYTLDALNQLARYLSNLPGRKNLIWFSGSFPINVLPDGDLNDPFAVVESAQSEFRQTVDLLSRGQVSVYPIDARGIMVAPTYSVSSNETSLSTGPQAFADADVKWSQETTGERQTMLEMADATGGRVYVNTNGLTEAVRTAIEAGSNYYTVAYSPVNENWNGKFRRIQIKVDRPGVTLAYRRGYYADDPNKPVQVVQTQSEQGQNGRTGPPAYNAMRAAMMHGAPGPAQLVFVADVRPSTAGNDDAAMQSNHLEKDARGPFRRFTIKYVVKPDQVSFETVQDGVHRIGLEFVTFVYDSNGKLVNQQANGVAASIPDSRFAETMKQDFVYTQQVSVPIKGEFYLRIGMRDRNTDNVGALEIPLTAVAKLQPASAAATPASGSSVKSN